MSEKIKGRKAGEHEIIGLDEPDMIFDWEEKRKNCKWSVPIIRYNGQTEEGCSLMCTIRIRARGMGKTPYCTERACPLKLND